MTTNEYIQESYDVLVKLGVIERVLINASALQYYPKHRISTDLVDCLFSWSNTPEGRDYWVNICYKLPRHLKNGCDISRRDAYHCLLTLHESQQSQPYEYW